MADFSIEQLSWLRPVSSDFRAQLKTLKAEASVDAATLAEFGNHALDLNKLVQLDKVLVGKTVEGAALSPMRLALLADATTEYTAPAIRSSALRHGVHVSDMYVPDYGQMTQEVLDPTSGLHSFGADIVLIAPDYRNLGLGQVHIDAEVAMAAVDSAVLQTKTLLDGLVGSGIATIIVQTLATPPEPWCGHFDRRAAGAVANQIAHFNDRLIGLAEDIAATVFDVGALADLVGRAQWFDHAYWHRAKLPFSPDYVPLYGDHVGRLLGALRGKARKCLVLDLDNTCWGGVIGDDGMDGIRIGQGSADGEAFLAVQAYALQLKARGVVLAVCSKNEDDIARQPFQSHPDMLLKEDDIAAFVANWTDKATNIRNIAKTLNIGTDALAFLDDNPAERERVRQMLPEVAVPELPDDPAYYPAALAQAGYFETTGLSADDAKRAEQYRANAARTIAQESIGDYDAYLASLDMVCDVRHFDDIGRTRIAQLINKSNQFNLTTRRYTEAEVKQKQDDGNLFALQVRLTDKFGDNGMISVVIFEKGQTEWLCDTWLMSCRVLKRRVEEAVLGIVAGAARAEGATSLKGVYIPTPKNRIVAEHFEKLGFQRSSETEDGETTWSLELATFEKPSLPMVVNDATSAVAA